MCVCVGGGGGGGGEEGEGGWVRVCARVNAVNDNVYTGKCRYRPISFNSVHIM